MGKKGNKKDRKVMYINDSLRREKNEFFNNLIKASQLAEKLGISIATIYDWKYRGKMRSVPENLFSKIGGTLYVNLDILNNWMSHRNSSL